MNEKGAEADSSGMIRLTKREVKAIGRKIWLNETSGKPENLIAWNNGETFVSLGIGHFIWYPPEQEGPFEESFPALIEYLLSKQVELPVWLHVTSDCPWTTRQEFFQDQHLEDQFCLLQ